MSDKLTLVQCGRRSMCTAVVLHEESVVVDATQLQLRNSRVLITLRTVFA